MKNIFTLIIALILFAFGKTIAQADFPPAGEVFVDSIVPRVDIFIDPDTLEWIYENVESYQEFHAIFIFNNGNISDTIQDIGFRLRGNTSRYSAKKSFKVSFNTFDPGRKWYGLEKLNLNGEHNDPSIIRSKLGWDLVNTMDVPGSRSNHVELFINNNYHGLYINVEHIDEEFVLSRFGNNDGNLYKCLWPADLNYLGSDPDEYKLTAGERRVYDLKTNTTLDDYSDLAHFIDVLNNTPDEDFLCEIEKIFNIYDYLKIIALDVYTANWDGYIFNKNNFYLYHNTETGKFEYINYDLDNTFGIDWFQIDWATQNIYTWHQGNRPLYQRVMNNEELRDQYSYYIEYLTTNFIGTDTYTDYVNDLKWRNSSYVLTDPFYPLDYGYSYSDYLNSYNGGLGMHVPVGIFPYIETRKQSVIDQIEDYDPVPVIKYIRNNHPQEGENLKIRAFVDCIEPDDEVKLLYAINLGPVMQTNMYDDGEHADKEAGDGIYGCILPDMQLNTTILYQVSALKSNGLSSTMPCEPNLYELFESENAELFINEFMASNLTTIADEFDEYDDWIEIFNDGSEAVWLGDKYLSDNLGNSNKWLMPDFTLEPGEFVLIWADNDPEQGEFHTNFKLDADGEEIGIFDSENTGFFLLDSISYGAQNTDVSMGRKADGGDEWIYFTNTTPGYSNVLGGFNDFFTDQPVFQVYPNPNAGDVLYFDQSLNFTIYTSNGIPLKIYSNAKQADVGSLPAGIYFIVTDQGQSAKVLLQ